MTGGRSAGWGAKRWVGGLSAVLAVAVTAWSAGSASAQDAGVTEITGPPPTKQPPVGCSYRTAEGLHINTSVAKQVLLMYGSATDTISFSFRPATKTEEIESVSIKGYKRAIITSVSEPELTVVGNVGGVPVTNMTFTIGFDGTVGDTGYEVEVVTDVDTYTMEGAYEVGGFVLSLDDKIVSGEEKDGLQLGDVVALVNKPLTECSMKWRAFGSSTPEIGNIQIAFKEQEGSTFLKEVEYEDTCEVDGYVDNKLAPGCGVGFSPGGQAFAIKTSPYRCGYGQFFIHFTWPSVELNGEVFETVLMVKFDKSSPPPCVALGSTVEVDSSGGIVAVDMFNLLNPPQPSDVEKVILSYDGKSFDSNNGRSTLEQPDQRIVFEVSGGTSGETYDATIECAFEDRTIEATYLGGKVTIDVTGEAGVAESKDLPERDGTIRVAVLIEFDRYDPDNYTVAIHNKCLAGFFAMLGGDADDYGLGIVRRGSAIPEVLMYADDQEDYEAKVEKLKADLAEDSCKGQEAMEEPCDKVRFLESYIVASDGSGVAGEWRRCHYCVWPRDLVDCAHCGAGRCDRDAAHCARFVGPFTGGSAEQTESDYSTSGPLGVPDPDDLLYNESVVRDVYGRSERRGADGRNGRRPGTRGGASGRVPAPAVDVCRIGPRRDGRCVVHVQRAHGVMGVARLDLFSFLRLSLR
eukprot:TRINITY_DN229_c0_g1_i5.p1 TRINITY_DN229_c0_g1~~TRINITY_DN229_c0_g1_i5.p1  ORF type:complete len:689 (+),score=217.46 TRINITY_DN229_c0_g1_i5:655-2721(+)